MQLVGAGLIAGGSILVHNADNPGLASFQNVFNIRFIAALVIVAGVVTLLVAVLAIIAGLTRLKVLLGIVSHYITVNSDCHVCIDLEPCVPNNIAFPELEAISLMVVIVASLKGC